jgi:hypothetical protein
VPYSCNPRDSGGRDKSIIIWGWRGQDLIWKKSKAKRAGGGVAWLKWYRACLATVRPGVQTSGAPKLKIRNFYFIDKFVSTHSFLGWKVKKLMLYVIRVWQVYEQRREHISKERMTNVYGLGKGDTETWEMKSSSFHQDQNHAVFWNALFSFLVVMKNGYV